MLEVGSRSNPSIKSLVIVVLAVMIFSVYTIISLATGDWLWFSQKFSETPRAIVIHCYGKRIDLDPGTFHFSALADLMNEIMSGRKRWDSLTLSSETYQDYQTNSQMLALEFFYHEPLRVHSTYKYYSNVDNLIIPLEGRHAQTNAVFGLNQGTPTAGSLHIQSTEAFRQYLANTKICPVELSNNK